MPVDHRAPNINARRLGLYLQRAREFLELSYDEAAFVARCDAEWLIRVETGFASPSPAQVERILSGYGVREAKVADIMIDLASRPDGPPWLARHAARMKASTRDVLISEAEACSVRAFGVRLVPDLVRCEAYFRLLEPKIHPGRDVDEEWDLLHHRQTRPSASGPRTLDVIVDESALTLRIDPAVMAAQLRHLLDLADAPHTTIRAIPETAAFHELRARPFGILDFPGVGDRISLAHTVLGTGFCPVDLHGAWETIEDASALSPDGTRALLHDRLAALD
ncbi:helix-turn-helix domain-containing protein [Actinocorallia populi]|uniref:helix-turn-helix domain-containing protein n=1 Tax=Actinocorallia populi TaxID=2079200 RepID=UPI000D08ACFE|nr:helix-turn-helix transcriptional regulator [Actinocorallia populi]